MNALPSAPAVSPKAVNRNVGDLASVTQPGDANRAIPRLVSATALETVASGSALPAGSATSTPAAVTRCVVAQPARLSVKRGRSLGSGSTPICAKDALQERDVLEQVSFDQSKPLSCLTTAAAGNEHLTGSEQSLTMSHITTSKVAKELVTKPIISEGSLEHRCLQRSLSESLVTKVSTAQASVEDRATDQLMTQSCNTNAAVLSEGARPVQLLPESSASVPSVTYVAAPPARAILTQLLPAPTSYDFPPSAREHLPATTTYAYASLLEQRGMDSTPPKPIPAAGAFQQNGQAHHPHVAKTLALDAQKQTASTTYGAPPQSKPPTFVRQSSKQGFAVQSLSPQIRPRSVECRAMVANEGGRCWSFELAPETTVNDAVSQVTQQMLRAVVESEGHLGERLSISVLPCVTNTTTVDEWVQRNSDQPPTIIIQSNAEENALPENPLSDIQRWQKLMDDNMQMLMSLQAQLATHSSIVQNRAAHIAHLQEMERQSSHLLGQSVARIRGDLAGMRADLQTLEEQLGVTGSEGRASKR